MIALKSNKQEGRWITADLHVHSIHSGGCLTPPEIIAEAQRKFLDAVAITDHDAIQGALEARDLTRGDLSNPIGIVGREISGGDHFHFLLFDSSEKPVCSNRRGLVERIAEHRQRDGLTILAHPWTISRNQWAKSCVAELIKANLLDGVELFNASILGVRPREGIETVLRALWEEWIIPNNLAVMGGSDFHHPHQREIGSGRTYIKVNRCDEKGILEAIRDRRCVAGLLSAAPLPFSWAQGGRKIFWGNEPWLSELKQLIQTVNQHLRGNDSGKEARPFISSLLACGHYQTAYDLLRDHFPIGCGKVE